MGDQQAAAVGQSCFDKGSVKSTYGTGAFAIMNTGNKKILSKNKLLTTICYRLRNKNTYALEGSIFIAGAGVQWLRDKIKLINNAYETEKIVKSKKDNEWSIYCSSVYRFRSSLLECRGQGFTYRINSEILIGKI